MENSRKSILLWILVVLSLLLSIVAPIITYVTMKNNNKQIVEQPNKFNVDDVYIGYDNYIWNGTERTEAYVSPQAQEDEVFEDTLGITGQMSNFFDSEYVSLAQNRIALMPYYKENANVALYSGLEVTDLTVYAKTSGKLSIGTARVSDVVNARKTGEQLTVENAQNYLVVKGKITIHFKESLKLNEDETIVLGGNNSVSLYCLKDIPIDDEFGNFTLLDNKKHDEVLAGGEYADTLAIQVKVNIVEWERPVFKTMADLRKNQGVPNGKYFNSWGLTGTMAYKDLRLFAGKRITRIDVPVLQVSNVEGEDGEGTGFFTVSVFENTKQGMQSEALESEKLYIGGLYRSPDNKTAWVNDWKSFKCDIQLAENQTLGFGSKSDTVVYGWTSNKRTSPYSWQLCGDGESWSGAGDGAIFLDVYYTELRDFETQTEHLETLEGELVQKQKETELKAKLAGKQFSIFGDSVCTFEGYSDNPKYNTTIGGQLSTYWAGDEVNEVEKTWWYKVLEMTEMNLCVNNSLSGDRVVTAAETKRFLQLHDDTPDDQQTEIVNPDIIAVYMGNNDFNFSEPADYFEKYYNDMLSQIRHKYANADVFLFTLLPNRAEHSRPESDLIEYNEVIMRLAKRYMCNVVDLYNDSGINSTNLPFYMVSGEAHMIHPNEWGMEQISQCFFDAAYRAYCEK